MSGIFDNYGSNIDSHGDVSDNDQDWSDFDDVHPTQNTQALEAKIKNQAAQIVDLEHRNSDLSERITELDYELSEVKRQNHQIAGSVYLMGGRHSDKPGMSTDDGECTDETGQGSSAAWTERNSSHCIPTTFASGSSPQ